MAYVNGQSLEDRIAEGPLEIREAVNIGCQLADGLQAAHRQGIVHRDLKPANVLLEAVGRVRIIDFGLAQLTAASKLTQPGSPMGTANYISPEQMNGEVVDHRSDIWSLGVILYELVTGRKPFQAEHREAVYYALAHKAPDSMSRWRANVPEGLERIVFRCLEKRPAHRYPDAAALRADLLAAPLDVLRIQENTSKVDVVSAESLDSRPVSLVPEVPLERTRLPKQSRRWMAFAAAGVLVAVAAKLGLMWLLQKKDVSLPLEIKQLTFDSGLALNPAVSPDARYLAFASDRAGENNLDIWVQPLPAGEPVRLTKDAADEDFPYFSPDGSKIAFQSERDGRGIYSVSVLGGEPRLLAKGGSQPRYSPDGQWLSFKLPDPGLAHKTLATAV